MNKVKPSTWFVISAIYLLLLFDGWETRHSFFYNVGLTVCGFLMIAAAVWVVYCAYALIHSRLKHTPLAEYFYPRQYGS